MSKMTLEEAITDAARKGRVRITVWPASEGYQANLSSDGDAWRVEMGPDPLTALKKALGLLPGASGPLRNSPPEEEDVFS
jgi:hypothetical protein